MLRSDLSELSPINAIIKTYGSDNDNPLQASTGVTNHQANSGYYRKEVLCALLGVVSGSLYFFVAEAGVDNIKNLFKISASDQSLNVLMYFLSAGASLCFATFTYKFLENISLKPKFALSYVLLLLAPIAAATFLIAGIEGASSVGLNTYFAIAIGLSLYAFRVLSMVDTINKFPEKAKELINELIDSVKTKNITMVLRLMITLFTAIGFSASSTDSIYAAINKILIECGLNDEKLLVIAGYFFGAIGALGIFPLTMYWTYRGLNQLTFGGKLNENGSLKDPTDIYTVAAAIATVPVILGSLGSVTSANDQMFGELGEFSKITRIVSSITYAMAGGVPGLSTLFRSTSNSVLNCHSSLFHKQPLESSPLSRENDIDLEQALRK